jgi:hypothetical protein
MDQKMAGNRTVAIWSESADASFVTMENAGATEAPAQLWEVLTAL